ncbi:MAG: hypothetical protein QM779_11500 [Propionicimonas sp.]|uniref:hypothetical protein n=1 Tax=Propionicimonas sp. TaxID=1955623 RepID=UPI003D0B310A
MRDLLVSLWAFGIDTQYSCQGDPDRFTPNQAYSHDYASQIVFADVDQAYMFVRKTVDLLGHAAQMEGGLVLNTMDGFDEASRRVTTRASVTFPPQLLDEITALWAKSAEAPPRVDEVS